MQTCMDWQAPGVWASLGRADTTAALPVLHVSDGIGHANVHGQAGGCPGLGCVGWADSTAALPVFCWFFTGSSRQTSMDWPSHAALPPPPFPLRVSRSVSRSVCACVRVVVSLVRLVLSLLFPSSSVSFPPRLVSSSPGPSVPAGGSPPLVFVAGWVLGCPWGCAWAGPGFGSAWWPPGHPQLRASNPSAGLSETWASRLYSRQC